VLVHKHNHMLSDALYAALAARTAAMVYLDSSAMFARLCGETTAVPGGSAFACRDDEDVAL